MSIQQIGIALLIIILTLLSGLADAQGFSHAANIWQQGKLTWAELFKSALGFGLGITAYWIVIKYLQAFGIVSAEIQTILWFTVTIVGVEILSGKFFHWHTIDQIVGVSVIAGVIWLLIRTSG